MTTTYITSENGTVYKHMSNGYRTFIMLHKAAGDTDDEIEEVETSSEVKVTSKTSTKIKYEIGDMNKYGYMKVSNTGVEKVDWVYVGTKGKEHPKVKHLFDGE